LVVTQAGSNSSPWISLGILSSEANVVPSYIFTVEFLILEIFAWLVPAQDIMLNLNHGFNL
jgi:hypothetical protein